MKILYVIWSLDLGGAEQVVMNLASRINKKDFEPVICCLNDKGRYAPLMEEMGIKVIALKKRPKFDLMIIPKLIQVMKREKISLVHTHLFTANLWGRIAAKLAGVPVVSTEHNVDTWKGKFHFTLDQMLSNVSKKIIFVSRNVEKFYQGKLDALNGKGRVLYNGIDVARFENSAPAHTLRERIKVNENARVIGIVGRLVSQKAHADFIEAIQILKKNRENVVGLIVGDGPLHHELRERVRALGLESSVLFTGFSQEMEELYKMMDVFVLCSEREGFPMTILEAMAAGVPVVATSVGGVGECITHGQDGLLIQVHEPQEMADQISRILKDNKLRELLVQNAQEKVRKYFSIEHMVIAHESLYEEVLSS